MNFVSRRSKFKRQQLRTPIVRVVRCAAGRTCPDSQNITFTSSYIDGDAQSLIDQINATLANWQANQSNWNVALAQSHTRDALGRITQTQETLLGASVSSTKSYQYDQSGRLISATVDGLTTSWGYDANGNRTQENGSTIASYDNEDRLQSWKNNSYAYNPAGDLASKTTLAGTSSYSYDTQGNLRSVSLPDGKNITYAIDPLGRRTGKSINGALQWQLVWLSSLKPLARLNADGTLDETYYYGDKPNVPEAMSKGANTYRIISDQNGSVRLVIDANTGTVAQQMDYDVWGNVINDTNPGFQPFGFAGGLYDPDTKLTRFGARDYDAETARWTAKDPILFDGGDSNLYGYVTQDPVNGIDPRWLWSITISSFEVVGVQATGGQNPNGSYFFSLQFGFGIGEGISLDLKGQQPGYMDCQSSSFGVGSGFYAQGNATAGPFSISSNPDYGQNAKYGTNDNDRIYSDPATPSGNSSLDPKDWKKLGLSLTGSVGGQYTVFWGGNAGDCTCH